MNFPGKIKDFWVWFWFGRTKPPEAGKILAKHLVRIFVKCPSCNKKFNQHKIAGLASRIYSSEIQNKIDELYESLRQKRWREVLNKDEFDVFEDALGVYVIKCPNESLYWIVLFEPYSLDNLVQLSEWNKIEPNDSKELRRIIPDENWSTIR